MLTCHRRPGRRRARRAGRGARARIGDGRGARHLQPDVRRLHSAARAHELIVDARMFAIASGVAALTAIFVTVPPALHVSRAQPMQAFGGRGSDSSRGSSRLRSALVVAEVAMATVLLIAAGLLIHSFSRLSTVDCGYQASNTLVFQLVFPPGHEVTRQSDTIETILSRLRAAPGVMAAGFARHGVLIGKSDYPRDFRYKGRPNAGRDGHPTDAGGTPGERELSHGSWARTCGRGATSTRERCRRCPRDCDRHADQPHLRARRAGWAVRRLALEGGARPAANRRSGRRRSQRTAGRRCRRPRCSSTIAPC